MTYFFTNACYILLSQKKADSEKSFIPSFLSVSGKVFVISPFRDLAPAKINLYLHVTSRRSDGYHELDSLTVFATYGDFLTIEEKSSKKTSLSGGNLEDTLELSGPFSAILKKEQLHSPRTNSVLRAASLWRSKAQEHNQNLPPLHFSLEKNLPVAAGIGGGTADASAALRLLAKHYPLPNHAEAELEDMALKLGADGPVTLNPYPKRMQGIGEILQEISLFPSIGILLVNPKIAVSTPEIFKRLDHAKLSKQPLPEFPQKGFSSKNELFSFLARTHNDLQEPAIALVPEIKNILLTLAELPVARSARMSGSGATCFALFETKAQAQQAEKILRSSPNTPQHWWIWSGETFPDKENEGKFHG